jgi:hypothetical protein
VCKSTFRRYPIDVGNESSRHWNITKKDFGKTTGIQKIETSASLLELLNQ